MTTGSKLVDETMASIHPPDDQARAAATALQHQLTKPPGSLGRLEELAVWGAGVYRCTTPLLARRLVVVAAADHGVACSGVSAYPQDVTAQMVGNFLAGGAAINVLARHAGCEVRVVDAGVASDLDHERLHVAKVRAGTHDLSSGAAMTRAEALALTESGIRFLRETCASACNVVALGDMGIGNTTVAAAITTAITGAPPELAVGRGTGVDDATFIRKRALVEKALHVNEPDRDDPIGVLSKLGGFEIAFLTGVALAGAASSTAIVLDGYPTAAAALIAHALSPESRRYMLASHVSVEPGHRIALKHLDLEPLLDLKMRLGEGTGAVLAIMLLDSALKLPSEMATFGSAGIAGPIDPRTEHES